MGYTHYFKVLKNTDIDAGYKKALPTVKKILNRHADIIQWENDDARPAQCDDEAIRFNGIGDEGHETFMFRPNQGEFDFCKTAQKDYDIVVCEVLIVLAHHIKTLTVSSDGDKGDWSDAVANVKEHYNINSQIEL